MYPELPDQATLEGMDAAALRTLALLFSEAVRAAALANMRMSEDERREWNENKDIVVMLRNLATMADASELDAAQAAAHTSYVDRLAAAVLAGGPDDGEGDDGEGEGDEAEGDGEGEGDGTENSGDGTQLTVPTGGISLPGNRELVTVGATWQPGGDMPTRRRPADGAGFTSTRELGEAIQNVMEDYSWQDPERKLILGQLPANFSDAQRLSGQDLFMDWSRISSADPDEIEAAFCPPLTPLYGLACSNNTSRPVYNGLPVFGMDADRGGFRVPTSPSLNDITTGYGQWTSSDDSNANALKVCQTITCPTWNDFTWYAVYRCLKVKTLMQMTFPELIDSYLNRLQARWARYAEILLLEQMGTASTAITAPRQAYGANVSLQRTILSYLGKYADIERWDAPVMDAWMPRWLLWALRMDIASRRKDAGGAVPSVSTVEQGFRDVGVEPHWFMDKPTWTTAFSNLAVNGTLTFFPSQVEMLIHRRGKFALMDKGTLNVGLGGNPIRIEDDLRRNQSTFFFESFEGIINTDSCPAHLVTIPGLCYNGFQIADKDIACEGYDMVGVGST